MRASALIIFEQSTFGFSPIAWQTTSPSRRHNSCHKSENLLLSPDGVMPYWAVSCVDNTALRRSTLPGVALEVICNSKRWSTQQRDANIRKNSSVGMRKKTLALSEPDSCTKHRNIRPWTLHILKCHPCQIELISVPVLKRKRSGSEHSRNRNYRACVRAKVCIPRTKHDEKVLPM